MRVLFQWICIRDMHGSKAAKRVHLKLLSTFPCSRFISVQWLYHIFWYFVCARCLVSSLSKLYGVSTLTLEITHYPHWQIGEKPIYDVLHACCVQWKWMRDMHVNFANTLRPRQDGRQFPDDIFKWIFWNENVWISIKISLKFVLRVQLAVSRHWFR